MSTKIFDVVVIGGGQAGLAVGYYLRRAKLDFIILDNQSQSGGAWNHTWPSLRLFSPAVMSSLPGRLMPKAKDNEYPHREPPRDCRRLNILREYDNEKTNLYS